MKDTRELLADKLKEWAEENRLFELELKRQEEKGKKKNEKPV